MNDAYGKLLEVGTSAKEYGSIAIYKVFKFPFRRRYRWDYVHTSLDGTSLKIESLLRFKTVEETEKNARDTLALGEENVIRKTTI